MTLSSQIISLSNFPPPMDSQTPKPPLPSISSIFTYKERKYAISFLILLISSIVIFDLVIPFEPQSLFQTDFLNQFFLKNRKTVIGACDYSYGRWVRDDTYPYPHYDEQCPFLDPGFRCHQSGRNDSDYLKWRWQPDGCNLPRFNASEVLERHRNGRIVFAGDSVGRNQWESLICMLAQAVSNHSTIYEENGNPITKHKGYLSMRFHQYNLTVEYYRAPFLVLIGRPPANSSDEVRMTVKLDKLHWYSKKWEGADVLVFNDGHWWNQEKTLKMGCYFQEGEMVNMTMGVMEAFQRSLQTWKSWAIENLNPEKTQVFFRSYSPTHYRNGDWNDGGHCDTDIEPEKNYTNLGPEPLNNLYISNVIRQMNYGNKRIQFLNITYLSDFRRDGHPSKFREPGTPIGAPQDCSHWCLPGVPDTWNELLYAHLISKEFRRK